MNFNKVHIDPPSWPGGRGAGRGAGPGGGGGGEWGGEDWILVEPQRVVGRGAARPPRPGGGCIDTVCSADHYPYKECFHRPRHNLPESVEGVAAETAATAELMLR